jgi:hypothetical protein
VRLGILSGLALAGQPGAVSYSNYRIQYCNVDFDDRTTSSQRAGRYRTDLDPAVKATEIVAFLTGMETSWLPDPSIPLTEVFREYTSSLARLLALPSGTR